MKKLLLFNLLFFLLAIQISFGQIPQTMSYQGVLTDTSGNAVAGGSYSLTFKLYDAAADGNLLWQEIQDVAVVNGLFNVILGSVEPLNPPFDIPYWLGITLGDAELSPRIELTSAPYSLHAQSIADSSVTGGKIAIGHVVRSIKVDGSSLKDEVALAAGNNVTITASGDTITISAESDGNGSGSGDITAVVAGEGLEGGGEVGDVILSIADAGVTEDKMADSAVTSTKIADGSISDANVADNAGIAESKLALDFPTHSDENDPTPDEKAALAGTDGTPSAENFYVTDSDPRISNAGDSHSLDAADGDPEDALFVDNEGNVGIGTTSPGSKLEVIYNNSNPFEAAISIHNGSGDQSALDFKFNGEPTAKIRKTNGGNLLLETLDSNGIRLSTNDQVSLAVSGEGNVGIGTTNPTNKLDVVGNIQASGSITSGNSITIDGTNNTITSTSDTINFDDENITTNGTVTASSFSGNGSNLTGITIPDSSITGDQIANGQVLRSVEMRSGANSITRTDSLKITAGSNITFEVDGFTGEIFINASGGGGDGNAWSLTGNAGTDTTINFLGTNDEVPLELRVFNERVMRIEPASFGINGGNSTKIFGAPGSITLAQGMFSPNLIGGSSANSVTEGIAGATIGGGGIPDVNGIPGRNEVGGLFGTISGGLANTANGDAPTIGGGYANTANGFAATISGGTFNRATAAFATIGGGGTFGDVSTGNKVTDNYGTVSGGSDNQAGDADSDSANAIFATIGGGLSNVAGKNWTTVGGGRGNLAIGDYATIAGGGGEGNGSDEVGNRVTDSYGTIGGGSNNVAGDDDAFVSGDEEYITVGGGKGNTASRRFATISGGSENTANDLKATIGGGDRNFAGYVSTVSGGLDNLAGEASLNSGGINLAGEPVGYSTVGGGRRNSASGNFNGYATVSGGRDNNATGDWAAISGGDNNVADGSWTAIGGGGENSTNGDWAAVPGGENNSAAGNYSFAAGRRAKANHEGSFVWADATDADFESTVDNQFRIRAAGGAEIVGNFNTSDGFIAAGAPSSFHTAGDVAADDDLLADDDIIAGDNIIAGHNVSADMVTTNQDAGPNTVIKIGARYRDNEITSWAEVRSDGKIQAEFGVRNVTRNSDGNYSVLVDDPAGLSVQLIPVAVAQVDGPPTDAASTRIVSVRQTGTTSFDVYVTSGNFKPVDNDFVVMVTAR